MNIRVKEVLLATNRRSTWRITPWGGCVVGLLVGALLAFAVGSHLLEAQRAEARQQMASVRSEVSTVIAALKVDAANQQKRLSVTPLAYVAGISGKNSDDLLAIMSRFPTFKTDPYKQLFPELVNLVEKQRAESKALVAALSVPTIGVASACSVNDAKSSEPLLWSSSSVSLSADGWRGVNP